MFQIKKKIAKPKTFFLHVLVVAVGYLSSTAYAADDHGHDEHDHDVHSQHEEHRDEQAHDDSPHIQNGREEHTDHHDEHGHHDDHDDRPVNIAPDIAEQSRIGVTTVRPVTLEIVTQAFGKLVIPPNQEAHIHARFPGLVKDIKVHVGDQVTKGDVLAVIESNESLQDYTIKAPMSGIVTQRQLNLGEVTDDEPLVIIIDDSLLWAELKIFPHQRKLVKQNQSAHLAREQRELTAKITHLAPSGNGAPYLLARVKVDNTQKQFTPGELVRANIVVEKADVAMAVENRALQMLEGQRVVFIKEGDNYERRILELGRTDGHFTEVLAGLQPGETYVTDNSYLIKADIEKAGAGHHHH